MFYVLQLILQTTLDHLAMEVRLSPNHRLFPISQQDGVTKCQIPWWNVTWHGDGTNCTWLLGHKGMTIPNSTRSQEDRVTNCEIHDEMWHGMGWNLHAIAFSPINQQDRVMKHAVPWRNVTWQGGVKHKEWYDKTGPPLGYGWTKVASALEGLKGGLPSVSVPLWLYFLLEECCLVFELTFSHFLRLHLLSSFLLLLANLLLELAAGTQEIDLPMKTEQRLHVHITVYNFTAWLERICATLIWCAKNFALLPGLNEFVLL